MSAQDYNFYPSELTGIIYLAKRIKSPNTMSQDRRIVTDNEIIGLFEWYLKGYCEKNNCKTMQITDSAGNEIFTATLKDSEK